ncbi:copper resistance CopC family protein [Cryobacterium psychrophilum]|uniref:Copper resistance protein CopC n=1 Tax=Cryobacterium psychrophilum TaxID=41988 RepID=A0A4Y8KK73_9MICO|nr:copper resistance CopC family protein [Cryobacterium psychrophilum]TDW29846.1 hypothetical protein EDD25_1562 [Cryobacterium psychrophilum]TFD76768.1 copper resistance protein CopC [Cryobacterium psychrophilum]
MSDPKRSRWAGGALAAVALALAVVVTSTVPASAHDQISSTTPEDKQQVMEAPTEVSLRFTEDVLSIGAIVLVVDSRGTDWADGTARLDGAEATQALKPGLPDGAYQVRWRVVSVDGHPISGVFAFSVGVLAPTASAPPVSRSTSPSMPANADATAEVRAAAATAPDGGIPIVVVGVSGALIGIVLFALVSLLVRKRARRRRT